MMRKIFLYIGGLVIVFAAAYCWLTYTPSSKLSEEMKKYICVAPTGPHYWDYVRQGARVADEEMGSDTKWLRYPQYDTQEQIRQLEKVQFLDCDGVITVGDPSSAEWSETIKEIAGLGIPVILIDTDAEISGRDCYIGSNNRQAGALAAQAIGEATDGEAECLVILSNLSYANQAERYQGFLDGADKYPDMRITTTLNAEGDKLTLQEQLQEVFLQYPSIDAIFCAEGASSRRLQPILEQLHKEGMVVVGFDNTDATLEFVRSGDYIGTIVQSVHQIGYSAVECLNQRLFEQGEDTVYTDAVFASAENIDEIMSLESTGESGD